jgi:phosphoribosyl-AMP cyclohydrolase
MIDPARLTYDANGLIPCIAQDHATGQVLMLAWMNADAVARTLATGRMTYWSRSRQSFWVKGETSGHHQEMLSLRVDCDGDTLLAQVRQTGPACHTGATSCFDVPQP